ncbi:MAG: acyl carrier protein [Acidimicrobiales bacterium]|nr:acyl carrier protein [Acidimicrobiales bacterium]
MSVDEAQVVPDATFESLDADSLDLVELVMALEEEFDVNVEEEELDGVNTIQAAFDLVTSKL